jgi:hypothetical protein
MENISLQIIPDEEAESPRQWDNLATMVCWHKRYTLGDEHNFGTPEEFEEFAYSTPMFRLPVFMYDHSGITLSSTPFSCPWDSGQIGWVYITHECLLEECNIKQIDLKAEQLAESIMEGELKTYNQYIEGDVWGFVLSEKCSECGAPKTIDSCWGFYGSDPRENGMLDHLEEKYHYLLNHLESQ